MERFLLYIWAFITLVLMENDTLHHISLKQFKSFFPDSPTVGFGDDFYILDARLSNRHKPLKHPCRFDGFLLLYCKKGHMKINVNLTEFDIDEGMVFLSVPGDIIRVNEFLDTPQDDVRYICVAMSREFVQGMRMDVNKLFNEGMFMLENPRMTLKNEEIELSCNILNSVIGILNSDIPYKKDAVCSLMSALFYLLIGIWSENADKGMQAQTTRSKAVFDRFIKLVAEYHTRYRNVGFYADKLCLTPKYLSKLIKNATGRAAPEWIDQYVMLEAKNLLKYSTVTIKEIVYRLNFPNQSVFYKFFKARTGMTPTEYRNS